MFFREKKSRNSRVLQLVENYRDHKGKVRQRIIISLGEVPVPDEHRRAVAHEVAQRMAGYEKLFVDDPEVAQWTAKVIAKIEQEGKLPRATCKQIGQGKDSHVDNILLDNIVHERSTLLGPLLVLDRIWQALGFNEILKDSKLSQARIASAKALVFNRLIDPCSEHELINWIHTTSLADMTGLNMSGWAEDRFYRIGDKLFSMRTRLEKHLREREQDIFNLERTVLLYDLTNTYFEGEAQKNEMAKRSKNSKEKRTDCPLISVGVVLDAHGFILTHKVFAGNISDCKTLMNAVEGLQQEIKGVNPVVIVDGGIATNENLQLLKDNGYEYVVNGKRQKRKEFAEDFINTDKFKKVSGRGKRGDDAPVFVRRIERDGEIIVLCRSEGRKEKEDAIRSNAEKRLLEGLEKIEVRIRRNDPRLKLDEGAALVNRAIGSLIKRSTRASKYYEINYVHEERRLNFYRKTPEWEKAGDLHGCYCLRCSIDLPDEELWKLYITLTKVETSFKYMKSDLGLRPVHHQLDRRCRTHVWITILAYHLLRYAEYSLECCGYSATWNTISRILQTHCYTTIVANSTDNVEYHVRSPGRPDGQQKFIYEMLDIDYTALPVQKRAYKKN